MAERNKDTRPEMQWHSLDCRKLSEKFAENSFDFVFDKTTIDAIMCGDRGHLNVARYLKEVKRVLKPGGLFVFESLKDDPEKRIHHLDRKFYRFKQIDVVIIPHGKTKYHTFICHREEDQGHEE